MRTDDLIQPTRAKLFGVFARIADMSGVDPLLLRIAGLLMLALAFKLTLVAYCVSAVAFRMAHD